MRREQRTRHVRHVRYGRPRLRPWVVVLALLAVSCAEGQPEPDEGPLSADETDIATEDEDVAAEEDEEAAGDPAVDNEYEPSELVIYDWGGNNQDAFIEGLGDFEEEYNVTLIWDSGSSGDNVARVRADTETPEASLAFTEILAQISGSELGLWAELDESKISSMSEVIDEARLSNGDGVGIGVQGTGIFYNTEVFEAEGWEPPTSFQDLLRPEFCGRVGMAAPPLIHTMMLMLMLADGDMDNVEPGMEQMERLGDCVSSYGAGSSAMDEKIQSEEYLIGVHGAHRTIALADQGFPVQYVAPSEGVPVVLGTVSIVENAPNPEIAHAFVDRLLSVEGQTAIVDIGKWAPVNSKVELRDDQIEAGFPTPDVMIRFDDEAIAERIEDWSRELQERMGL